jgi:hypothetical protein
MLLYGNHSIFQLNIVIMILLGQLRTPSQQKFTDCCTQLLSCLPHVARDAIHLSGQLL